MYIGQFEHTIDTKNRIFLPARFRQKKQTFIVTRGLEPCLAVYDTDAWAAVIAKLEHLEITDKARERGFKRALLSGAHEAPCDGQGRILIPQGLKEYAHIRSMIVVVGVGTRFEVWDAARWGAYYAAHAEPAFRSLAARLEL